MKFYNLAAMCPNSKDVTSIYRGAGPIMHLRNIVPVQTSLVNLLNWNVTFANDVLFIQRPSSREHLEAAKMAKDHHIPLWIDYDDFLLGVPTDNPSHDVFMKPEVQVNIIKTMELADIISVSTRALKALYQQKMKISKAVEIQLRNIVVIPNAYYYKFHHEPMKNNGNKLITWRGTDTHERDLLAYARVLVQFMNENPDWKIEFIGYNCWQLTEQLNPEQVILTPGMDPSHFMNYLRKRNPSLHIVPLHDSFFNRSKSNIAWLEATIAGAACLVPDWDEWKAPGVIAYQDEKGFYDGLNLAKSNIGSLEIMRQKSLEHIMQNLMIDDVNQKRANILKHLIERTPLKGTEKYSDAEVSKIFDGMNMDMTL